MKLILQAFLIFSLTGSTTVILSVNLGISIGYGVHVYRKLKLPYSLYFAPPSFLRPDEGKEMNALSFWINFFVYLTQKFCILPLSFKIRRETRIVSLFINKINVNTFRERALFIG